VSKGGKKENMNSEESNSFWLNYIGQIRNWISSVGILIFAEVLQYFVDNMTWTWRGLLVSFAVAVGNHVIGHQSHTAAKKHARKVFENTVITTQEVLEKKGEHK
jgi:hypothetical protein